MNKIINYLKNFDWILFVAVLVLLFIGLAEIYSIALGQEDVSLLNFKKQIFFVLLGVGFLFLFALIDYHVLKSSSNFLYIFAFLMLLAVLFLGTTVRGTTGWFSFGAFGLQPVEFVKIVLIIFLANFFSAVSMKIQPIKRLLWSFGWVFLLVFLVLLQPDFGSSFLLVLIWFVIALAAGFKKKYFVILTLILTIVMAGAWVFLFKDYQKERVLTFLNPSVASLDQGYNVRQAIIAVGSGGISGRGIGFGSQSQLKFLPEAQNDFIFAVIAEELGFLGVILVVSLFFIFFIRCLLSIKHIKNDFGIFFILGASGLIFIEMFINIGMNIGLVPVIGISLPFLSYGGSSMVSTLILVGIIESIIIRSKINY